MPKDQVLVLTYHSVSDEPGPTSTPASVFRRQMEALAVEGYRALTIGDFIDWRAGADFGDRKALITFDDGFADFETAAHPALQSHGFSALMFVPTRKVGGSEAWGGANSPARPLMGWDQIKALAKAGVEFGSHSLTHADLTRTPPDQRREEIASSGAELADQLGVPTRSFAAPYGAVNAQVLADIRASYETAFGVRLDKARRGDDPADVPRVEMHYFRDPARWAAFLAGDDAYFHTRRALRGVRQTAMGLMGGAHG